jgi:hypothetical protein
LQKTKEHRLFIEDISLYFLNGQTRKYTEAWETRLYKTLKLLNPDGYWSEMKIKGGICDVEKAGAKLEVYRERTETEIRKMK